MASDRDLVDMLDAVWASTAALGDELDETEWKQPSECPGWTVQDNLVHLTALERFILGDPLPSEDVPDDLPHVKNDIGKANERWIESRRSWTGADALAEFRAATGARIEQLRGLDDAGFAADSWTPMGPGTVADLLRFRIFDSWVHEQDMRRAVHREGNLASASARQTQTMIVDAMPFVVGKKVAPPDGSTVVFSVTEPLPREFAILMLDGRAGLFDEIPADPTARLTMSWVTFERLACGRVQPALCIDAHEVRFDGDADLGRRVVAEMNYMF